MERRGVFSSLWNATLSEGAHRESSHGNNTTTVKTFSPSRAKQKLQNPQVQSHRNASQIESYENVFISSRRFQLIKIKNKSQLFRHFEFLRCVFHNMFFFHYFALLLSHFEVSLFFNILFYFFLALLLQPISRSFEFCLFLPNECFDTNL